MDLGEVLDPMRKQVIDIKDALAHARYRYDGLDLILGGVADGKVRGAAQEIFAVAGEKMDAVDDLIDELYRQLSALDRVLENLDPLGPMMRQLRHSFAASSSSARRQPRRSRAVRMNILDPIGIRSSGKS